MAEYHENTVEKHKITKEEVEFLKELQKEMNTQDTVSQADSRFWVVAGTKKEYVGKEYGENDVLVNDIDILADGLEKAIEFFKEEVIEDDDEDYEYIFEKEETKSFSSYRFAKIDKHYDKTDKNYNEGDEIIMEQNYITDIKELIEALEDADIICQGKYDIAYYRKVEHVPYPDTMFLTYKSCKEHINLNHYHYSNDAHPYAMTAWCSPEIEKLFKIIQEIDWDKLL